MESSKEKSVNCLHTGILNMIHDDLVPILNKGRRNLGNYTEANLMRAVFRNYRKTAGKHRGIRLTTLGNQLLRNHYVAYDYIIEHKVSNKALLTLDQHMTWPYYVGKTRVSFYSENDAAWFTLNGNNLDDFVDYL